MSDSMPTSPGYRVIPVLVTTALSVTALIVWSFGVSSTDPAARGWLFAFAGGAVFGALRRRIGPALVLLGIMALGMHEHLPQTLDAWSVLFLVCASLGTALWLKDVSGLRWILVSVPFWVLSDVSEWLMFVAMGMSLGGLVLVAVGPTLPGRRLRTSGAPLPHLASGPLVPIVPRAYAASHRNRALSIATIVFGVLAVVLPAVSSVVAEPALPIGLALASAIMAITFAFSNWFAGRARLRIDEEGLHSRTMFQEHTIPWNEIATLSMRYVFLPGMAVRIVYYCVRSPTREFAFPSSMPGAKELQAAIEQATGMVWPEPEIEANF